MDYTQREISAVRFYQGSGVFGESDPFYMMDSAYQTLNLLMMPGREGERVRVGVERQNPKSLCITRWEKTLEVMTDLFTVLCKYAREQREKGAALPNPLARGDRGVNFRLMEQGGGTIAFTSTSHGEALIDFVRGKQEPHLLHITLGDGVPYLDYDGFFGAANGFAEEREVLLPPMVPMCCSEIEELYHPGLGMVRHCHLTLKGFAPDCTVEEEDKLIGILNTHAETAAEGLNDLVKRRLEADILAQPEHPYWIWKAAFRQLVLQRMKHIHSSYC